MSEITDELIDRIWELEEKVAAADRLATGVTKNLPWLMLEKLVIAYQSTPTDPVRDAAPWLDPEEYNVCTDEVVQVLCRGTQPQTSDFPRACEMPISSGDHGVGELFVSIGWRDHEGEWFVAGWDMMQDCWTDARCFEVLGWAKTRAAIRRAEGGQG